MIKPKASVIQMTSCPNIDKNLRIIDSLIKEAKKSDAKLILDFGHFTFSPVAVIYGLAGYCKQNVQLMPKDESCSHISGFWENCFPEP